MTSPPLLTLPTGQKMPMLGLGTFYASDEKELETAIATAIELGYRHIDTAWAYENEAAIGKALKKLFSSGKIKREEIFITTKLPMVAIHPDRVETFMKKSLENLQLDYVDLYLVHFTVGLKYKDGQPIYSEEKGDVPTEGPTDHVAIWKKMEEQVDAGRTKNIGLSNYNVSQITTVLKAARIKPANLQLENHVFLQQREIVDFCHKNGMTVTAYMPLANPSFNKFLEEIGKERQPHPHIFSNSTVLKLAEKYKKSAAQIALKFLIQRNIIVIPKSVIRKELEENINIFDFSIDENDMKLLRGLEMGEAGRLADFKLFTGIEKHPDYPFPQ